MVRLSVIVCYRLLSIRLTYIHNYHIVAWGYHIVSPTSNFILKDSTSWSTYWLEIDQWRHTWHYILTHWNGSVICLFGRVAEVSTILFGDICNFVRGRISVELKHKANATLKILFLHSQLGCISPVWLYRTPCCLQLQGPWSLKACNNRSLSQEWIGLYKVIKVVGRHACKL